MFFSPLDIRSPLALSHRHNDWLALSLSDQPSSSSNVYNLWQNASSDLSSYALHHLASSPSDPLRRSFPNFAYQDDRSSNSRLVPMLPYSATTTNNNDTFSRRSAFASQLSPSPQHIPTTTNSLDEERSSRSLIFDQIYSSPSYTLSAAISSAPGSGTTTTATPPSGPLHSLFPPPPPPPPSSCSPHTSPSSSPPSSPDCHHLTPPSLPSVHAFRLDTLQSVDPSDDPCPLSLHDLMIPSEEQEYQGHSYHFSLQSVSPSNPTPQSFSDEKPPHEESALPKRKGKSKMHTCSLCQKSFPRPSGLRTHMNSHSGDKRVSCRVASPKSADLAHFVISLQVPCYVLRQVFHCPFKRKASHPNARRPSGSSSRGSLAFGI
jgi:Zinc finger, C2H2 type